MCVVCWYLEADYDSILGRLLKGNQCRDAALSSAQCSTRRLDFESEMKSERVKWFDAT